jgi:hypothetical protein
MRVDINRSGTVKSGHFEAESLATRPSAQFYSPQPRRAAHRRPHTVFLPQVTW